MQCKEIEFEVGRTGVLSGFAAYMTACLLRKADGEEGPAIPGIQTWVWDEEAGKEICRGNWAQQARFDSCIDEALLEIRIKTSDIPLLLFTLDARSSFFPGVAPRCMLETLSL